MDDFLLLESQLQADELLARDTVRRYVDDSVMPVITEAYEQGVFPQEFIAQVADLGLLGLTLPAEVGGAGANYVTYGLVCQELERGDSGLRSFVSVQSSLCMYPIYRYGSTEQQQHYLPAMAAGKLIACFGLTEPDSGSDPASMRTNAVKVNGGWRLNGSKLWITNAPFADVAIVWAQTENGVRGFLVDKDIAGFERNEIKHKMSLRASSTGELVFSDCFIPDSHYLPGSERGLGAPLSCLTQARYGIAWGAMGAAMACYQRALAYSKERKQFGKPIGSFQLVQKDLVDMLTEIVKTQCFNLQLGRLHDNGQASATMVSMGKMNAAAQALIIARKARNILGANGISLEYEVIRHMNNLESIYTYEGADNIHHLIIGRELTGINAFS